MKHILLFIIAVGTFCNVANGTSYIITSPEENVRKAPLIVEATVLDIRYEKRGALSFAVVRLKVNDHIVGNSADIIEIRRAHVTSGLEFLHTDWIPKYTVGEKFIATLFPASVGYGTIGLYNGKFIIEDNIIQNTNITIDQFKKYILDMRADVIDSFPETLPRQGKDMDSGQNVKKTNNETKLLNHQCGLGEHHLDGEFNTWNFTWDPDFIPAQIHYNPDDAHPNAPGANDIADLAQLAYELWEDDFSFFSFQNAAPFVTNEGQVDNNTSVILWEEFFDANALAVAFPFPNTQQRILNCDELGPGSNTAVDIIFNSDNPVNWHFGVNPPANHQTGTIDFVEVLAHELGHGLGLAHTDNTNSIMIGFPFGGYGDRNGPVRGQTDGDLAANIFQHTVSNISGLSGSFPFDIAVSASTKTYSFSNDFTVPAGRVLELAPGVTFSFASGRGLIANGQLNIQGTSANPVVLEPTGSSWAGVHLHGSGSLLSHAHIEDAVKRVERETKLFLKIK